MPEFLRDQFGGIVTDDFGGQVIDERFNVLDDFGGVVEGGRLDPNRTPDQVREVIDAALVIGDRPNEVEKLILFEEARSKGATDLAGDGLQFAKEAVSQITGAASSLRQELQGAGKRAQKAALDTDSSMVTTIGNASTMGLFSAVVPLLTSEGRAEVMNAINNLADGAVLASAGVQTLGTNVGSGLASLLDTDVKRDYERFSARLDRRLDLRDLATNDIRSAVLSEAFAGVADALDGTELGEIADEISAQAAAGSFATEKDMPGVQFLGQISGDPTALAAGPALAAANRGRQALVQSSGVQASATAVKRLAKQAGRTLDTPAAKRLSELLKHRIAQGAGAAVGIGALDNNVLGALAGAVAGEAVHAAAPAVAQGAKRAIAATGKTAAPVVKDITKQGAPFALEASSPARE